MHYWITFQHPDGHYPEVGTDYRRSISGNQYKSAATLTRYAIRPFLNGRPARVEICTDNKYAEPARTFYVQP